MSEPQFRWNKYSWVSETTLPSWRAWRDASGPYGAPGGKPSDGKVRINIVRSSNRDQSKMTAVEKANVSWAIAHEAEMAQAMLAALVPAYAAMRSSYGSDEEDLNAYMPEVAAPEGFRPLIGLHTMHVHALASDDGPYVGFEFGCEWDAEHGLGILMQGTRVVEIGGADIAIMAWVAERDADKRRAP